MTQRRDRAAARRDSPAGLRATILGTTSGRYVVLSYPLPGASPTSALTSAEREVLALMLAGASNAGIARQRDTAVRTVANQVAAIFRKLGVSSRSQLAALLARHD
jgi:DNA-binding CsgD family transcriptional regulator